MRKEISDANSSPREGSVVEQNKPKVRMQLMEDTFDQEKKGQKFADIPEKIKGRRIE